MCSQLVRLLVVLVSSSQAAAFSAAAPRLPARRASTAFAPLSPTLPAVQRCASVRHTSPSMGLFGLGWGEIAIVGVIGLFLFGPDKLAPFAKELGKSASGLKEVTDSFSDGMSEGNLQMDLKNADDDVIVTAEAKEVVKEEKKEA